MDQTYLSLRIQKFKTFSNERMIIRTTHKSGPVHNTAQVIFFRHVKPIKPGFPERQVRGQMSASDRLGIDGSTWVGRPMVWLPSVGQVAAKASGWGTSQRLGLDPTRKPFEGSDGPRLGSLPVGFSVPLTRDEQGDRLIGSFTVYKPCSFVATLVSFTRRDFLDWRLECRCSRRTSLHIPSWDGELKAWPRADPNLQGKTWNSNPKMSRSNMFFNRIKILLQRWRLNSWTPTNHGWPIEVESVYWWTEVDV